VKLGEIVPHQTELTKESCGKSIGVHGYVEKFCELDKGHEGDCGFKPVPEPPKDAPEEKPFV